ncbi:MAG TPA: M3 family metallopeptidase, partial [Polyangiaceae bacterium]|nr:M3 family metallopeptidase [Polyangiaceae bacterium]
MAEIGAPKARAREGASAGGAAAPEVASQNNPLLGIGFDIPFDALLPAHVEPAVAELLERSRRNIEAIENDPSPASYDNTLERLDTASEELEVAMTVVGHLETVMTSPELREVYNRVRPEVSAFYASIPLRPRLWQRLKAYGASAEAATLGGARARFLKKTLEQFRREGADLQPADKQRLEAISRELSELTSKFGQNVVASTAAFELVVEDPARLAGLPEAAQERAREEAKLRDLPGYRFSLQGPSMIPLLTYAADAELRRQVSMASEARATSGEQANPPLIQRILELRREQATLLGFADFADLVLADRMAKTGATARQFVDDLAERCRPAFEREQRELLAFRRRLEGPGAPELERWDVGYYAEKQRQALYDFDSEELRPFFPLDRVVQGLFETAERLYGVQVRANAALRRWHPDVRAYDIIDERGELLASFYADFFPRESKRDGAWMNALISGTTKPGASRVHLGLICCNVTPPVGNRPALLSHQEVETLFHEFGHLLHHCLSRVEVRHLVGTNVAWDFVELPSQIMENWCWEREALRSFARHYETGAPIPDELFEKMQRARTYREATATTRQLGFATVDLTLHVAYDPERDGDLLAYARRIAQPFSPAPLGDNYAMIASFNHLFSSSVGYAAGYYSYKWAEVLDADAFTRFKREGVFSRQVGEAFRR